MSEPYEIEQMETFEKQTFRNRCLIRDPKGEIIRLTVPVGKVEHKQLTRDIQISYKTNKTTIGIYRIVASTTTLF